MAIKPASDRHLDFLFSTGTTLQQRSWLDVLLQVVSSSDSRSRGLDFKVEILWLLRYIAIIEVIHIDIEF